jgi:uncharacterized membrane protein
MSAKILLFMKKVQFIFITFLSFLLLNEVTLNFTSSSPQEWLQINSAAHAKRGGSTGGRSRGGSFGSSKSKSSSPSRSSRSSSNSTRSRPTSSGSSSTRDSRPTSQPTPSTINQGNTGGRVRGGDFSPKPTAAPAPTPYTSPTYRPNPSPSYYPSRPYRREIDIDIEPVIIQPAPQPYYQQPYPVQTPQQNLPVNSEVNPVTQPATIPQGGSVANTNTSNDGAFWKFLFFLLLVGGAVFLAWYLLSRKRQAGGHELDNDIVTVSKLQIALLAEARHLQSHLSDLSVEADLETSEGLAEFLRETALALLRSPEYWTHALVSSQTVKNREAAARIFEQLSIEERSKFSAETFSNVSGRIQKRSAYTSSQDNEPAAYIVVTFLVGTEDDKPLFESVHSTEEVKETLQKLAAITPEYLLIFELLWSPENEIDSLTYDELLIHYSDMIQI